MVYMSKIQTRTNKTLVTVVIPTFNRKEMLMRCIASVLKSTYSKLEIIVADDASKDDTKDEVLKNYGSLKNFKYFKNEKEMMLSATINKALTIAKGKYIFILDDDNVIEKKCIEELISTFERYKEVGIVGPLAIYYSKRNRIMHAGTLRSKFMRRAIYPNANEVWKNRIKAGEEREDFANAFMFRKDLLKKVGGWDLLIPSMGEDADFEARVRIAGYKIVINPRAITYHDIPYDPANKYFMRISDMRMYNGMHSKILYEARYDSNWGKLTFAISVPVYLGFYFVRIAKSNNSTMKKLHFVKLVLAGTIAGIIHGFSGENRIKRFRN